MSYTLHLSYVCCTQLMKWSIRVSQRTLLDETDTRGYTVRLNKACTVSPLL
jgi:hypothetical protein